MATPQGTSPHLEAQSHRSGRRSAKSTTDLITEASGPVTDVGPDVTQSDRQTTTDKPAKRKKNRHRKRRNRRHSFITADNPTLEPATFPAPDATTVSNLAADRPKPEMAQPFYKLGREPSSSSLESEALLDHRDQPMMRPRRESRLAQSYRRNSLLNTPNFGDKSSRKTRSGAKSQEEGNESDDSSQADDRTPLVQRSTSGQNSGRAQYGTNAKSSPFTFRQRRPSGQTITSSRRSPRELERDYDINNPPSIPGTPKVGPEMNYDDAVVTGAEFDFSLGRSPESRVASETRSNDMVIDMETTDMSPQFSPEGLRRRRTVTLPVEEDVCFPTEMPSGMAEEEEQKATQEEDVADRRRRRHKPWPDLSVLEEWSRDQKEERTGDFRAKKIHEPMLIEGRLRPQYRMWRREEDEVPYRFTYFNEEFKSTIHAQTISELVQLGGSFRELFIPDPPELEDSSDDEGSEHDYPDHYSGDHPINNDSHSASNNYNSSHNVNSNTDGSGGQKQQPRALSIISEAVSDARTSADMSPARSQPQSKPKRYGPRPAFWLDVLCPTDAEMRVLAKAFGIHALTAEDIMMQEAREKVELFRHYYFVNYRTFEQDPNSENYLQPVNMYVVVFREGVLSFHFSQTPHPANVRRRIRQLMDYLILSSDWISYALIDDITDVFGPLIHAIEDEVDEIDETIMRMHSSEKTTGEGSIMGSFARRDMLRRVGECRKKVMGMYRLLSNKADVVKGFAKRCNEHWEVAPKSEIGLYLGDIQDHIMTMTSSLTYYETLLSRAHSNYLAQINMMMNERQEQTADVLGRLTVLGTIVLPMNIICGMWGMNVKVPGQDIDNLYWFTSITLGLLLFGVLSFIIAKRVYQIV